MRDKSLDELIDDYRERVAQGRRELEEMRPGLIRIKANYVAYADAVEKSPVALFSWAPPIGDGTFARLPPPVEKECAMAVLAVLKKHIAKCNKALGVKNDK